MGKFLVILALVAFENLNFKETLAAISCYECRSYEASGCDISSSTPSNCPDGFPYCIAFSGVTTSNETVYFRNCFRGECDLERKTEPNVELKQCKACETPLCNDDEFEPKKVEVAEVGEAISYGQQANINLNIQIQTPAPSLIGKRLF